MMSQRKIIYLLLCPRIFIVVDYKSEFGALSIYNTNAKIYEKVGFQTEIYIVDPFIKIIKFAD